MIPENIFSLSMTYDASGVQLVAVYSGPEDVPSCSKAWQSTDVCLHSDNEWHTVRDLLVQFVSEAF